MTFPTATTGSANSGGNTASYSVALPDSLAAGDLVVLCVTKDGTGAQTWPVSPAWTQIGSTQSSDSHETELRYRRIDGTEGWSGTGNTVSVTGASEGWASAWAKITGHHDSTNPEAAGAFTSANSTAPNPPSLDPSGWATEDTLWLVAYAWDGNSSHSAYPANYSSNQSMSVWANSNGVGVAIATRNSAAASEDPGTATISSGTEWAAFTVAVRPGLPSVTGTGAGNFTISGSAAGVRTVVGTATGSEIMSGASTGVAETFGTALLAGNFTAAVSAFPEVVGSSAGVFIFTGTGNGSAGTPEATGTGTGAYNFTGAATGAPELLGQASATFGWDGAAAGFPEGVGQAGTALVFDSTTGGVRTVIGQAAGPAGFVAGSVGVRATSGQAAAVLVLLGVARGGATGNGLTGTAGGRQERSGSVVRRDVAFVGGVT